MTSMIKLPILCLKIQTRNMNSRIILERRKLIKICYLPWKHCFWTVYHNLMLSINFKVHKIIKGTCSKANWLNPSFLWRNVAIKILGYKLKDFPLCKIFPRFVDISNPFGFFSENLCNQAMQWCFTDRSIHERDLLPLPILYFITGIL